jgi:UDP-2,3-diacylglucosamine pyrophosphatase LpxH
MTMEDVPRDGRSFDYLIVSDLHLRGGVQDHTVGLYHFDEEFADFLRYYRLHRASTRPWMLVIDGDFIEFLYVTDLPAPNEPLLRGASFSEVEHRYGASTEAQKARWKLDTILRRSHPQLLLALARFVAEGNDIVIVRGNHDAELVWPEVQEHFRRLIAEHHPADVSYMDMKTALAQRVQFAPWFWYVPGVLYVEHGCQYDPFCSFEYFLNPVLPSHPTRIENSISDLSVRYFANQVKLLDAMAVENIKSISEYVWWMLRNNWRFFPRAARLYVGMVRNVLASSGSPGVEAESAVRAEHTRRLVETDERFGLPPGTTAGVHALHAEPVMRHIGATARFLGLDLLAAGGILATATLVAIAYPGRVGWRVVLLGVALALGLIIYVGALRVRRITDAGRLHRVAERIADLFDVPYVLFGHSHRAGTWQLRNGGTYFNVGTWVPLAKKAHFVYFALTGAGPERSAGLWRWNKAEGKPEPFTNGPE